MKYKVGDTVLVEINGVKCNMEVTAILNDGEYWKLTGNLMPYKEE